MTKPLLPRIASACGIVFPIALFVAAGNGHGFAPWRAVVSTWALILFLPFLAYLCSVLREAEGDSRWLSTLALIGGLSGALTKLISHVPELAIHQDHLVKGTSLYTALDHMGNAATILSLYPLAVCAAAVAVVALRTRVLPRWIGIFASITALALVVNSGFVFASFVPAFLVFLLWTLATGLVLVRRSRSTAGRVAYAT